MMDCILGVLAAVALMSLAVVCFGHPGQAVLLVTLLLAPVVLLVVVILAWPLLVSILSALPGLAIIVITPLAFIWALLDVTRKTIFPK